MYNASQPETQPGIAQLMSGILADAQELVRQQLALFRHEIRSEIWKAKEAGALVGSGAVIALVGLLLISLMAVHLLSWAVPTLPLWACYGLVGVPVAAVGGMICVMGMRRFRPLAGSFQALEENVDGRAGRGGC